jgi:hypothetical protein
LSNTITSSPSDPSSLSFNEVKLALIGMTETGLLPGLTYSANPQRINMSYDSGNAILIQPLLFLLDLPLSTISDQQQASVENLIQNKDATDNQLPTENFFGIGDISLLSTIRILFLVGYLIYAKVRRSR